MNEEYLWDKSGEPDPEIQNLEEILGTLRYQPQKLELPYVAQPGRSRLPWLAIAAALLLALLAGVVWLQFQSKGLEQNRQAVAEPAAPGSMPSPEAVSPEKKEQLVEINSPAPRHRRQFVAVSRKPETVPRRQAGTPAIPVPSKEALLAKEQLIAALRLASEKLNLAQKKAQGPSTNPVRNQHKVG